MWLRPELDVTAAQQHTGQHRETFAKQADGNTIRNAPMPMAGKMSHGGDAEFEPVEQCS